jgi:hypothetical protein
MHILFIFSTPQRCADRSVQCNMDLLHLDPDACFRKTTSTSTGSPFLKLAVLDSEDERDLLLDVWRYVRSGDLQVKIHSVVFLFLLFFFFFFFFFFKILMIISSFVFVCVYTSSTPTSSIPHLFSSLYSIHHSI